ncbi:type VII secretion-associated serine protease mycosin [Streptomyces sp. NPDC096198]|uniref:type VII secretion-associated serine protease mycosin n=1 Tax=Streptomyces sp. NPDC096198 TaxID=3366080 RepID=UPI00380AD75C
MASADYVRGQQWVLDVYRMNDTWAQTQGEGVTVAVVDSGVDGSHADLAGQVLEGRDFTGGNNAQQDLDGHGTSMASLIAGHGHGAANASGMVGLAPKAKILPLRVLETQKDANHDATWAAAVRYAVDHGAKVINLSFSNDGGKTLSEGREAIAYAESRDVVVVASAGNQGSVAVDEPAALPGVVSVGAVDKDGNRWDGSNTGNGLTLMAPGVGVLAADPTRSPKYSLSTGTSDATAYVSATAALVRSKYPNLTAGQVVNRLIKSASFLGHKGLKAPDKEYGYGIIRPLQAVTMEIPAGPKKGPLAQLSNTSGTSKGGDDTNQARKGETSTPGGLLILVGAGVAVIAGAVAFAVIRSRRKSRSRGIASEVGFPSQHSTYPSAQNASSNREHVIPPGQASHYRNPPHGDR